MREYWYLSNEVKAVFPFSLANDCNDNEIYASYILG